MGRDKAKANFPSYSRGEKLKAQAKNFKNIDPKKKAGIGEEGEKRKEFYFCA
jgi:hypothetical protein